MSNTKSKTPNPRRKGYPLKRKPIPDDQLERDRKLSRQLHSVIYALPFLVVAAVFVLWWLLGKS